VLKILLCAGAVGEVIERNGDDADPSGIELFVMCFELTQLEFADRSPPAAEKDEGRVLFALEVGASEGLAVVGPCGAELREGRAVSERS